MNGLNISFAVDGGTFRVGEGVSIEGFVKCNECIHSFEFCICTGSDIGFIPTNVKTINDYEAYRSYSFPAT